ncbi:MFS transporter [Acinetobacter cumulans]|uniref:MFS transporter n=2 Tax=Acinetobacter cumulans TaxID=2136182 RepID=A0ABX9U4B6_9GAMM|nr:MFS transporter [Acinetobacter cumulans]
MRNIYVLLFSLYWAQGLPVGFMTHALPVILRAQGVSLAHIGGFGLLMLPWSIKVFWAPWIDRIGHHKHGHYRSWILPLQGMSIAILILLSFMPIQALDQPLYLMTLFVALLSMNMVGATQDVATDGLAVSLLKSEQQHWGNMFQVVGSRLGFIVGGGAILWALDWLDWQSTFLALAVLVFFNSFPILFYKEPVRQVTTPSTQQAFHWQSLRDYLTYFVGQSHMWWWLMVLLSFKIADGLAGPLLKPLMVDLGLSYSQIGIYVTMLGALAALLGAGLAGYLLKYIGRFQALWLFSVLKVFSLGAYAWLAWQYQNQVLVHPWLIYTINAVEDMLASMLLVVMLTLVMQYSRKRMAGTDFTFQVSVMATVSGGLYIVSGIIADQLGYALYLSMICVVALLSIIPMLIWHKECQKISLKLS